MPTTPTEAPRATRHAPRATDWPAVHAETLHHLRQALQVNTTNPPGNELLLAKYLDSTLAAEGIETRLFEPIGNRAVLVARIRGSGAAAPVLMLAHMDVVGVEPEHWTTDPFGGEVRDGYVYGRGAIDDKGMLIVNLMTMLLLKREMDATGRPLSRDVIFAATSDEEVEGKWGIGWLIENHPDLIRAEFALNEGGRTRVVDGRALYVAVQVAEKVSHIVHVTAYGPGGHASVPLAGNAIARLARAVAAITNGKLPVTLLPSTRRFFADLSEVWPEPDEARAMADLASDDAQRVREGAAALEQIPVFDAVLRSGISPTIVTSGVQHNVIPADARAVLNIRTLPGDSIDNVLAVLKQLVDDALVEIELSQRGREAPASDFNSPMFDAIKSTARELDPSLVTVPYLGTGATESSFLRAWGVETFGVLPFPLAQEDERRMHSHDERVPVAALEFGTRLVFGAISKVAS